MSVQEFCTCDQYMNVIQEFEVIQGQMSYCLLKASMWLPKPNTNHLPKIYYFTVTRLWPWVWPFKGIKCHITIWKLTYDSFLCPIQNVCLKWTVWEWWRFWLRVWQFKVIQTYRPYNHLKGQIWFPMSNRNYVYKWTVSVLQSNKNVWPWV